MAERAHTRAGPLQSLPTPLTSLVGRAPEIAAVGRLLGEDGVRLLTLTGPPGIGKTRLAIHGAAGLHPPPADGVCFVNLAPVVDPARVLPAIATALGMRPQGNQPLVDVLAAFLAEQQMLLLLDNFEQVLPAGPAVARLLQAAPGLRVLVTSRELLHLSGEHAFVVPPLAQPPVLTPESGLGRLSPPTFAQLAGYEAVQLFVQRAVALQPNFALDAATGPAVAEICRRLDGLPLAIELAAARVRHLPPAAILDRLGHRLQVLTGGAHDLPDRQRTLRATLEWSHALLDDPERTLFRRLAAFRGGRTLAAIEAVCDAGGDLGVEPLAGVSSLVDKSLLSAVPGPGGTPRYVLLETLHEFARAMLAASGEEAAVRHRHARYFAALAEDAEPRLRGPDQAAWLDRLEAEQDNFRAALDWAAEEDIALAVRLAAALGTYWSRRGPLPEARERTAAILARAEAAGLPRTRAVARALHTVGLIAFRQGDFVLARSVLQESVDLYTAQADRAAAGGLVEALNVLGVVAGRLGDMPARRALQEQARALAATRGDTWGTAQALCQLGHTARICGDLDEAQARFAEGLAIFQEHGDQFNIGLALVGLGHVAERRGDLTAAQQLLEQSLTIFRALGDPWGIHGALYSLACLAQTCKDYRTAEALHEESIAYIDVLGAKSDLADTLENLGRIAYFQGDYAQALERYQRALARFGALHDQIGSALCLLHAAGVAAVASRAAAGRSRRPRAAAGPDDGGAGTQAVRVLAAATARITRLGIQLDPATEELRQAYLRAAQGMLSPGAFAAAWRAGQALTDDEALALAAGLPPPERDGRRRPVALPRRPARGSRDASAKSPPWWPRASPTGRSRRRW